MRAVLIYNMPAVLVCSTQGGLQFYRPLSAAHLPRPGVFQDFSLYRNGPLKFQPCHPTTRVLWFQSTMLHLPVFQRSSLQRSSRKCSRVPAIQDLQSSPQDLHSSPILIFSVSVGHSECTHFSFLFISLLIPVHVILNVSVCRKRTARLFLLSFSGRSLQTNAQYSVFSILFFSELVHLISSSLSV